MFTQDKIIHLQKQQTFLEVVILNSSAASNKCVLVGNWPIPLPILDTLQPNKSKVYSCWLTSLQIWHDILLHGNIFQLALIKKLRFTWCITVVNPVLHPPTHGGIIRDHPRLRLRHIWRWRNVLDGRVLFDVQIHPGDELIVPERTGLVEQLQEINDPIQYMGLSGFNFPLNQSLNQS